MNNIQTLLCGNYCTICINNENEIYSCGKNTSLKLGHENNGFITNLIQIKLLNDIKMVSCGRSHTVCIDYNGNIFTFGRHKYLQLGIENRKLKQTYHPQKLNLPPIKHISCGRYFTICVTSEEGNVYSFGRNENGELGLGHCNLVLLPQQIPKLNNIEYSICGLGFTMCKNNNDLYYCWGVNEHGALALNNYINYTSPVLCDNIPDATISIKCGNYHCMMLTSIGQVYSCGGNRFGQLGFNPENIQSLCIPTLINDLPEIQRVECGYNHNILLDVDYNLWLFGWNGYGQLGLGDDNNRFKPILHKDIGKVIDISSGGSRTYVKTINNKIYAMGNNKHSHLGIKTLSIKALKPIQVLKGKEDYWGTNINSRAKSARK